MLSVDFGFRRYLKFRSVDVVSVSSTDTLVIRARDNSNSKRIYP